ncbi:MAG: hypothetical protein LBE25_00950 [Arthrobacter sp.]|jgi:hypothetical protein|nr:hypothetical protein [Arthrobacter sp.]
MLIGRKRGPRFEACVGGVRLIGYCLWPDLLTRRNATGQLLRPSYTERAERAFHERERAARAVEIGWDEVLALGLHRSSTEELRQTRGRRAVARLDWRFDWELPADLTGDGADRLAAVDWSSPVQPPYTSKDPWLDVPQRGLALIWIRTAQGVWAIDAPLDRKGPLNRSEAAAASCLLEACVADPGARSALPATWPTGPFRPATL